MYWKTLWNLKIPGQVKFFLWQACHNILLIRLNLVQRKIIDKADRLICGVEETKIYVLWEYPTANDVWCVKTNPLSKWTILSQDFRSLWMEIVKKLSQKDRKLCAIICRNIWLRRNSFVFDGKFESSYIIMIRAISQLGDFQEAQLKATKSHTKQPEACDIKKWQPLKAQANWDAALNSQSITTGL